MFELVTKGMPKKRAWRVWTALWWWSASEPEKLTTFWCKGLG